jgi:hypothetical protein
MFIPIKNSSIPLLFYQSIEKVDLQEKSWHSFELFLYDLVVF